MGAFLVHPQHAQRLALVQHLVGGDADGVMRDKGEDDDLRELPRAAAGCQQFQHAVSGNGEDGDRNQRDDRAQDGQHQLQPDRRHDAAWRAQGRQRPPDRPAGEQEQDGCRQQRDAELGQRVGPQRPAARIVDLALRPFGDGGKIGEQGAHRGKRAAGAAHLLQHPADDGLARILRDRWLGRPGVRRIAGRGQRAQGVDQLLALALVLQPVGNGVQLGGGKRRRRGCRRRGGVGRRLHR